MGCLKLTYRQEPDFRVIYSKKELTLKNSSQKVYRSYLFGFNGQESVDEISGVKNHYTAPFWEYDPRTARRWNLDPVDQISVSNYAAFLNNPIWFVDPLGNSATKYEDEAGNELANTDDGSKDVIVVPNARLDEFKENIEHTPKESQDKQGWNNYWKTEILGFETTDDMEGYLGNASSQWSRQKLIDYRQNPTLENWTKWLGAEVLSQNANPLNHLPSPINVKTKVAPKIKVETKVTPKAHPNFEPWTKFNKEMGPGKFTKEKFGSTEAASKARREAFDKWKQENGY